MLGPEPDSCGFASGPLQNPGARVWRALATDEGRLQGLRAARGACKESGNWAAYDLGCSVAADGSCAMSKYGRPRGDVVRGDGRALLSGFRLLLTYAPHRAHVVALGYALSSGRSRHLAHQK